jgi:hypothetical protein
MSDKFLDSQNFISSSKVYLFILAIMNLNLYNFEILHKKY